MFLLSEFLLCVSVNALLIYLTGEHFKEHFSVLSLRTKCSSFPRCRNSDRTAGCTRGKHTIPAIAAPGAQESSYMISSLQQTTKKTAREGGVAVDRSRAYTFTDPVRSRKKTHFHDSIFHKCCCCVCFLSCDSRVRGI